MFRNRHRTLSSSGVATTSTRRRSVTMHRPRVSVAATVCAAVVAGSFVTGAVQAQSASAARSPHSASQVSFRVDASTNPSSTENALRGVSCPSPNFCMSVGYYVTAAVDKTLAERWSGVRWTTSPSVSPSLMSNYLDGVSCTSSSFCMAVGAQGQGSSQTSLIEEWNGRAWATSASTDLGTTDSLNAVSCASTRF